MKKVSEMFIRIIATHLVPPIKASFSHLLAAGDRRTQPMGLGHRDQDLEGGRVGQVHRWNQGKPFLLVPQG